MAVQRVIAQLRTTNLDRSIDFYVSKLGLELEFRYEDFYAGLKAADGQSIHLKRVDAADPAIGYIRDGGHLHLFFEIDDADATARRFRENGVVFHSEINETAWRTKEFYLLDDQGHVLCFAQSQDN